MTFALAPAASAAGYRLRVYETIGSTNVEALEAARLGDAGPAWFVARHQSEGRGRRASAWQTAPGNLAATLLLTLDLPPAAAARLGFVAGVALARALEGCCGHVGASFEARPPASPDRRPPQDEDVGTMSRDCHAEVLAPASLEARTPFSLKWPNDVLADGAKLAGILLGTEEIGGGRRAVAVGIGVNVVAAPDGLPYRAASLRGLGCATTAERLFERLSATWTEVEAAWDGGRGFDGVRRDWLARAAGLGRPVSVRTGAEVTTGLFETIDSDGRLVIRARDGTARRVSAGEVQFGAVASAAAEEVF